MAQRRSTDDAPDTFRFLRRTAFGLSWAIAALWLVAAPVPSASAQDTLRIAAVVNDEIISAYDVQERARLIASSSDLPVNEQTLQQLSSQVLRTLIDEKLKLQEAERLGIEVSEEDIDNALASIEQRNNMQEGGLVRFLENAGLSLDTMIQQVRADLAWSRMVSGKYSQFVQITDEEVNEALAEYEAAKGQPENRVAEIFIPIDDPTEEQAARQQAEDLVRRLRSGASFQALARNFSQSRSAANGGDLGWLRQGALPQELAPTVQDLQPGQLAGPIRTTTGYYIVLLVDRRIAGEQPATDVQVRLSQIHLPVPADAPDSTVQKYVQSIREKTGDVNGCDAFEQLGREIGSQLSGSVGTVKLSSLSPDRRNSIDKLPVGEPSEPISVGDAVVVLMVCERIEPESQEPEMTAQRMRVRLVNERMAIYARKYLRDLRRDAFIEIR